ncbi:MAG: propanediol utilization protein [Syntrophomonas sp.]
MLKANVQMISEEVSGKCINLCHIIKNPDDKVTEKLSIEVSPLAIVSISPGETAIIVADYLSKSAALEVIFIDRYLGTVLVVGEIGALETACTGVLKMLRGKLAFEEAELTRS